MDEAPRASWDSSVLALNGHWGWRLSLIGRALEAVIALEDHDVDAETEFVPRVLLPEGYAPCIAWLGWHLPGRGVAPKPDEDLVAMIAPLVNDNNSVPPEIGPFVVRKPPFLVQERHGVWGLARWPMKDIVDVDTESYPPVVTSR